MSFDSSLTDSTHPNNQRISYMKVKLSLGLINYAACHEDVQGGGGKVSPVLPLALDRSKWSISHPCQFSSLKTAPILITQEAGWAPVWILQKKEKSLASVGSEPRLLGHPACNLAAMPTELSRLLNHT
jgi:hypothetical protein